MFAYIKTSLAEVITVQNIIKNSLCITLESPNRVKNVLTSQYFNEKS